MPVPLLVSTPPVPVPAPTPLVPPVPVVVVLVVVDVEESELPVPLATFSFPFEQLKKQKTNPPQKNIRFMLKTLLKVNKYMLLLSINYSASRKFREETGKQLPHFGPLPCLIQTRL